MAGNIKGITIEIDGNTTPLQKALQDVNKTVKNTQKELKEVDKLLKFDPKNTELLSQKQTLLGRSADAVKDKLDKEREALRQLEAQDRTPEVTEKMDQLKRAIIEDEQQLKKTQKALKEFGSVGTQQAKIVGEKMQEIGGKMQTVGKNLTTHVTLPLVAVGTAGAKSFAEVDKTMQLANKTMGNTEEQAELLNSAMKDAAANSTFGMSDAATATLNFARAGLDAEQAAAALAPAMNLAAGEGGSLDTVSAGLVATINGFHGSFSDAGKYADVFASACNNSALDVDSLASSMSIAAPIFSTVGKGVEDAALYMGIMANNGIEANVAANSLKTGMARLAKPAKEASTAMEQYLGGWSAFNEDGTMKSSLQIQKELHDSFSGLSEQEQMAAASAIFGKNQMAPWLALINAAPEDVNALSDSLKNCGGTTEDMANTMMSGFGGSLEKLKSSIDVLMTSIGEALAPTIKKVADVLQSLADKFNALTPAQQQMIVQIATIVAVIGPIIAIVGGIISGIGTLITSMTAIAAVFGTTIGVVAAVGAGIVALIAIIVLLVTHWDTVKKKVTEVWDAVKKKTAELRDDIRSKFSEIKTAVQNKIGEVKADMSQKWNAIKKDAVDKATTMKSDVTAKIGEMKTDVTTKMTEMKSKISEKLTEIKTKFTEKFTEIQDKVKGFIDKIKGFFENLKLKIPKPELPALPHFSLRTSTKTILGRDITYPSGIDVNWYAKAMNNPYLFTRPTLIGAGEAGAEMMYGRDALMRDIAAATSANNAALIEGMYDAMTAALGNADLKVVIGRREFGRIVNEVMS